MTAPGQNVFAAIRWRRSLPTGISSRFCLTGCRAAGSMVAARSRNSGATLAAMLRALLPGRPILRAPLRARDFPFHYPCVANATRGFAPSRKRSLPIPISFTMPDTARTGQPRRGDCLSGADSDGLTEGHSMISLDEAMLYAPVEWHDCSRRLYRYSLSQIGRRHCQNLPSTTHRYATPSAR